MLQHLSSQLAILHADPHATDRHGLPRESLGVLSYYRKPSILVRSHARTGRVQLQNDWTRRVFLRLAGTAAFSALESTNGSSSIVGRLAQNLARADAAHEVIRRILPQHGDQVHLSLIDSRGKERFQVSGFSGSISIEGSSHSALLMGFHWYLKFVANVSISWNGDSLDQLPLTLPAPGSVITRAANVRHRFALNDTNDGYTCPFWSWKEWEHQIDVLALHGINEVLVYLGAEAVYQQTFRQFHLTDHDLLAWFPTPAHQPWWLLGNMSGWVGPSCSQHLIDGRLALARRITDRLRDLDMMPVLPGYFGMLPDGFAAHNPEARVVPQGTWLGMKRPDWLDPTSALFADVAGEYYRVQEKLLGPSRMFKMDPLHEGGQAGSVNFTKAAQSINARLQTAHPGAIWAILGWQKNPRAEVIAGIADKEHVLILDGESDRYDGRDRDRQWNGTPYAFGTIWNFGGHTTMGANVGVWNDRYFTQLEKAGSSLRGIAVMPEASCNNPVAFEFFTEMAWRDQRPDLANWFREWSCCRYGGKDENAARAWEILRTTAYDLQSGKWSEAHDSLFTAQPSLTATSACSWSPQEPRYDLHAFSFALQPLLNVDPRLQSSSAYRFDLVDVARQTIANQSRSMLPEIQTAYTDRNLGQFRKITQLWLELIDHLNCIVETEPSLLLGLWLRRARAAAAGPQEKEQLEFDATSILLEWGPESSRGAGIHDYASREWSGMLHHYRERWAAYFSMLTVAIQKREPPRPIDWFTMDQRYAAREKHCIDKPRGDARTVVKEVFKRLEALGILLSGERLNSQSTGGNRSERDDRNSNMRWLS